MKTIIATNETLKDILKSEMQRLGNEADLNYIDISNVANMDSMFSDSNFCGFFNNNIYKNV
jgi:hypothetical protein